MLPLVFTTLMACSAILRRRVGKVLDHTEYRELRHGVEHSSFSFLSSPGQRDAAHKQGAVCTAAGSLPMAPLVMHPYRQKRLDVACVRLGEVSLLVCRGLCPSMAGTI